MRGTVKDGRQPCGREKVRVPTLGLDLRALLWVTAGAKPVTGHTPSPREASLDHVTLQGV